MARTSKTKRMVETSRCKQRYLFPIEVIEELKRKADERIQRMFEEMRMNCMDLGDRDE